MQYVAILEELTEWVTVPHMKEQSIKSFTFTDIILHKLSSINIEIIRLKNFSTTRLICQKLLVCYINKLHKLIEFTRFY